MNAKTYHIPSENQLSFKKISRNIIKKTALCGYQEEAFLWKELFPRTESFFLPSIYAGTRQINQEGDPEVRRIFSSVSHFRPFLISGRISCHSSLCVSLIFILQSSPSFSGRKRPPHPHPHFFCAEDPPGGVIS